jgi:hypothetical protein
VTVISIGRGRAESIAAFVERTGMRHPVAVDAIATFESWDVGAVPVAFLIDAERKIVAHGLDDAEQYLRTRVRVAGT